MLILIALQNFSFKQKITQYKENLSSSYHCKKDKKLNMIEVIKNKNKRQQSKSSVWGHLKAIHFYNNGPSNT